MAKRKRSVQRPATAQKRTRRGLVLLVPLVVATLLAYSNSLSAAFVHDDRDTFLEDTSLGKFTDLSRTLLGVPGGPSGGRPLTSLSFHLNALVAGQHPAGYRAVNIALHLAAGLVLFALVRRLFAFTTEPSPTRDGVSFTAFAVALLWLVHPLQTESVTYVSQRAESLMGLFFLLTLYCAVRGFADPDPARWYRCAAVACTLSVLAKEVGVVAPLVLLVYDRACVSGGFRRALMKHRGLYLGLGVSWVVAGALQATAPRGYSVGFSNSLLTPLAYFQRQIVAVLTYLKLSVWPSPLIFDYGLPPPAPPAWQLVTGAAALTALAVASCLALTSRPLAGFAGISFFLVLAPTSSVIPILTEVIAEHRMYLPLACVLGVAVAGVAATGRLVAQRVWLPRPVLKAAAWALLLVVGTSLAVLTRQRNAAYRTEKALWLDTTSKVPDNPRAQCNLGMAYLESGDTQAALERFRLAVTKLPNYFEANANMSVALERLGRLGEALAYIRRAAELDPTNPSAREQLVRILARLGRWEEALAAGKAYVDEFPASAGANALYASLLAHRGQLDEAQRYKQKARELTHTK